MEEGGGRNGDPASASGGKRWHRRKGKQGKGKGSGGGSAAEPQGTREAEGATAGADGGQGGAAQATPRDAKKPATARGGDVGPEGRREVNNGDADRDSVRLRPGVHGDPGGGRNGGVGHESPRLGGRGGPLGGSNGTTRLGLGGLGVLDGDEQATDSTPLQGGNQEGAGGGTGAAAGEALGAGDATMTGEDGDAAGEHSNASRGGGLRGQLAGHNGRNGHKKLGLGGAAQEDGRAELRNIGAGAGLGGAAWTVDSEEREQRAAAASSPSLLPRSVDEMNSPRSGCHTEQTNAGIGGDLDSAVATIQQPTRRTEDLGEQHGEEQRLLPLRTFLSDSLLSWTIHDVLNDDLYKEKVPDRPFKFTSVQHYASVYSAFLLEETRSLLSSDIKNVSEAQFCKLLMVEPCDSPSLFYVDIDLEASSSDPINFQHVAKDFDICLLSTTSPKDSDFNAETCCLAIATQIDRDTFYQKSFKISVATIEMFQPEKMKFVIFLTNISYKMEISEVLALGDESDKRAIQTLQEMGRKVGKRCNVCYQSPHCKDASVTLPMISMLTSRLNCPHEEYTGVVCAPPGTLEGFISILLKEFIHQRKRVLICLPKESCIPQFLLDIEETVGASNKLDEVLVLNSVKGLGTCSKVEKTCLENKSQELYCCLNQCIGWLQCMSNLLELKAFNHSPRCIDSKKCDRCHFDIPFSVQMFSERFADIVMKFRDSLYYLVNNARAICLVDEDCNNILKLLDHIEKVQDLLHSTDFTDACVIEVFGLYISDGGAMVTSEDKAISLNEHRMSSIKLIDTLSKSLQLPQLENRDELDRFCIEHSSIIVTSINCMGKLRGLQLDMFDIMIVTDAGQLMESDLLVPFVVPMRHIVFFGDHLHLQPLVHSEICKKAGFNKNIYVRLQKLTSEKLVLTHQSIRHPMMNQLINNLFYSKKIDDAPDIVPMKYNEEFKSLKLSAVSLLDVPSIGPKSKYSGKYDITFAAINLLLQDLGTDANKKLSIVLVCLSNNEANAVVDQLGSDKEIINGRFHLQVKVLGNLDGELFDVVIISTIVENIADLIGVDANRLNVALTSSRQCCILIGRSKTLVHSGVIWKKMEKYLSKQNLVKTLDIKVLTEVMQKLDTDGVDHLNDPKYAHSRKRKPGQERTWHGRPSRTKHVLPDVRDQRGQPDTCILQATSGAGDSLMKLHNSSLIPPQDCGWKLSVDDFKKKHEKVSEKKLAVDDLKKKNEKVSEKKFTLEDIADRGIRRLIRAFEKFKEHGVEAINECRTVLVKLSAYKEIVLKRELNPKSTEDVKNTLKDGNILVGSFRQSMNYYNLRPGEVYVFDEKKPIKHPKSNLTASHAVMIIGIGHDEIRPGRYFRHMGMQNSEGRMFGINGLGRVAKKCVRTLFQIELEKPPGLGPF